MYILIGEALFDRFFDAMAFWVKHPTQTFGYAFLFSITGYIGINIVLHLVKHFGALIAVTGNYEPI